MPTMNAGLFEDMLEVDFDGSGSDAKFSRDFPVLHTLLHQLQNLLLAVGQGASRIRRAAEPDSEYRILHPGAAFGDGPKAREQRIEVRRFSNDAPSAGL